MIRMLVVTTLYPNKHQPRHGIFVETRIKQLILTGRVSAEVIAPVPWFPFGSSRFGKYATYAKVPKIEQRNGMVVRHPRYLVIPKIGMMLTPFTLSFSILCCIRQIRKKGESYDIVDAHYYFPDGVAIALVSMILKKPFLITARGSDINLISQMTLPRRLMIWASGRASASIAVCDALKKKMVAIGMTDSKIQVFKNGVDTEIFKPVDSQRFRNQLGLQSRTLLSVGNLIELKGHHLVIEALRDLPDCELVIVGDGEQRSSLAHLAKELALDHRVHFVGVVPQKELVDIYNACDVLILASSSEGMANVLLESIACGTPVVTTNVGGAPEVITSNEAGVLIKDRTAQAIVDGVRRVLGHYPDRVDTSRFAHRYSWSETVQKLLELISLKAQVVEGA